MSNSIRFYELSKQADIDLEEIFDYTEKEFDFDQAVEYLIDFEELFNHLIINPELGKKRDEIVPGLRSFPIAKHVVFYRLLKDRIRIVRVLHGSRDIPNFLK